MKKQKHRSLSRQYRQHLLCSPSSSRTNSLTRNIPKFLSPIITPVDLFRSKVPNKEYSGMRKPSVDLDLSTNWGGEAITWKQPGIQSARLTRRMKLGMTRSGRNEEESGDLVTLLLSRNQQLSKQVGFLKGVCEAYRKERERANEKLQLQNADKLFFQKMEEFGLSLD